MQRNKKAWLIHIWGEVAIETEPIKIPYVKLTREILQINYLNMFKKLRETISRELKESMRMMPQQIEKMSKETEVIKRRIH